MQLKRLDWFAFVMTIFLAVGCGGGGCGGCAGFQPIPGGFPAAKREPNAAQVRLSNHGLAKISADPGRLVSGVIGGPLEFNVPGSCGTLDICCPGGNTPSAMCGPIALNVDNFAGMNGARLEMNPQVPNRLEVVIRSRIRTVNNIPASGFGIDCQVDFNSERSGQKDLEIRAPITFTTDATAGTTKVVVGELVINRLEEDDFRITGDFLCGAADWGIQYFLGPLKNAVAGPVREAVQDQTCKACPSGAVDECGPFATACTDNVCMKGDECMQELGISGRLSGAALLGSLSPGTTGSMDLYEVAGGDGEATNAGMSLFLLGGMQPAGTPRDRCGPPAVDPGVRGIARSPVFRANDYLGQQFDFGIGIHKHQLEQMAYAAYDGGLLCLTLSSSTVAQLNTDTLSLVSRSLGTLNEGNAPMAVGLRPQSPPVFTLGRNIFTDDGMGNVALTEALLTVKFTALELDFFAAVDDQYIRVFTVVADVELPVGLQVTSAGEIAPVLGDVANAFTNISVKNSEAVAESPAELTALFPSILNLVLPQISGALSPIALPSFAGLTITPTAITSVEDNSFLAIFANLTVGMMPAPVHTTAVVAEVVDAPESVARRPTQWQGAAMPAVKLALGGDADDLEYSVRIDRGTWSAWSKNASPTLTSSVFWLPGTHRIEVRSRRTGQPHTIDDSPVALDVELGGHLIRRAPARPFHGQPGEAGCNCSTSSDPTGAAPLALALGLVLVPLRRARRAMRRSAKRLPFTSLVLFVAITLMASLPGCSCGSNPCGDVDCLPGEVSPGGLGRWTSIAADDTRVLVATYDQGLGDLVIVNATDPGNLIERPIDGVPTDVSPVYDPSGYRGGVEDPGPNVGAWTSIAISEGTAKVAYQDRENGTLKYAFETAPDKWESYTLDPGDSEGEEVGRYAHMIIDAAGHPAIAYLSIGNDDGEGHRVTELRIARAGEKTPGENDWNAYTVATGVGSCGGLCNGGEACIDQPEGQRCTATTSDCTATCATTEACVAGACTPKYEAPTVSDLAGGTGLFVSLVQLPDGRLAATYYDRTNRALAITVETAAGSNEYLETRLHEGPGDRGLWASSVVDGAGTVHIAYQDAISDTLLYTTWNGAVGPIEMVDDGTRAGDRPHNVGAGAALYLVGGSPVVAYQDGMTSDVLLASRSGAGSWTSAPFSAGPLLDGFSIGVATHAGANVFAWDRLDPALSPPNTVHVQKQ